MLFIFMFGKSGRGFLLSSSFFSFSLLAPRLKQLVAAQGFCCWMLLRFSLLSEGREV